MVRRKGSQVSWNGKSFESLSGSVGVQLGYSVTDELKRTGITVDDGARTSVDVLHKLLANRVEAAVMLLGEFSALMADDAGRRAKLEMLPIPFTEKPYYLMLSNQLIQSQPELVARLWQSIAHQRNKSPYQDKERRALSTDR